MPSFILPVKLLRRDAGHADGNVADRRRLRHYVFYFYILYGAMKFVGGMLVDKINPKAMTGPVLIGVGIVNILFGFSDSVAAFYVLYSLNAILQGTSFPPMAKIMASWFSKTNGDAGGLSLKRRTISAAASRRC